jgi:hypothetical protein
VHASNETQSPVVNAPVPANRLEASTSLGQQALLRAPAKENLGLFAKVAEAIGGQLQQSGEEVVTLKDESLRFDKSVYPVVVSPALRQRVVLDPGDRIPGSLKSKLNDPNIRTPVLPMSKDLSVRDAVRQLLGGLGYQTLPDDRPVVIQDRGITYEARGDWMALGPEESNQTQEVYIINLSDKPSEVPEYLKAQLAKNGLRWRDVGLDPVAPQAGSEAKSALAEGLGAFKTWPRSKEEMVDAVLLSYGVTFGVAETLSVELRDGLRVEMRIDRLLDIGGKRTALFFRPGDGEVRKVLEERQSLRAVELNIATLSSREIIAKLLTLLGEPASYREHRFSALNDTEDNKLVVKAWGFQLAKKPLFITDRQVPPELGRFFFEKGLEIVYFQ